MFRVGEVATVLGVSSDTVRRWVDTGRLPAARDGGGRRRVDGVDLGEFVRGQTRDTRGTPTRNRLSGIVTEVVRDTVMAQVEIMAGPYRVVSLMSREAADELGPQIGVLAIAVIKSTKRRGDPYPRGKLKRRTR